MVHMLDPVPQLDLLACAALLAQQPEALAFFALLPQLLTLLADAQPLVPTFLAEVQEPPVPLPSA